MEKTKVLTKLDFKTLKYCNLFLMKFQRKTKLFFYITAILSLGIAIYDIVKNQGYMFAVLGGIFIIYSLYQLLNLEKKLDTSLINFFHNRKVTNQTIEIDDEKIIVTRSVDPENPVTYDWSFVTMINEMPQYYMLMIGKGSPIIIDRSIDALLEGTKENLDRIIQDKASLKPYKKTDEDIVRIPITYVHQEFPNEEIVETVNDINASENAIEVENVVSDNEHDDIEEDKEKDNEL